MTPSQLKAKVSERGSLFFTIDAMQLFGDSMRNYGVRGAIIDTLTESQKPVWELYRKAPVKNGLQSSAYFDRSNFNRIYPKAV